MDTTIPSVSQQFIKSLTCTTTFLESMLKRPAVVYERLGGGRMHLKGQAPVVL